MARFLRRTPAHKPAHYRKPDLTHRFLKDAVGVWYLNEGAGPVLNAANGREGQLVGNVAWDAGILGQHVDFTAAGGLDRIDIGQITADDPLSCVSTQQVTIIACVRTPASYSNQYPRIFDKSNSGSGTGGYCFNLESTDRMEWYVDGTRVFSNSIPGLLNRHVVFAISFNNIQARFFIDGNFAGSTNFQKPIPSTITNAAIGNWNHSSTNRAFGGDIYGLLVYNRGLDDDLVGDISRNFWAPLSDALITFDVGVQTIGLDVADLAHAHPLDAPTIEATFSLQSEALTHAHPVDALDVEAQYILAIDGTRHAHSLDECAVFISEAITLAIESLRHGHRIDEVVISPTWTLIPAGLRHLHPLDGSALYWRVDLTTDGLAHIHPLDQCAVEGADEIVLSIDSLRHAHAVDSIAMTYETSLIIETLRHAHPVDAPAVSMLMGDATSMIGTDAGWKINAGNDLINAAGADLGWHIVEAVFDGTSSVVGVDGVRVGGNAGVRELTILSIGSQPDGSPVLEGEIGELRIYNGNLSPAQRDAILAELQAKWL